MRGTVSSYFPAVTPGAPVNRTRMLICPPRFARCLPHSARVPRRCYCPPPDARKTPAGRWNDNRSALAAELPVEDLEVEVLVESGKSIPQVGADGATPMPTSRNSRPTVLRGRD